jgi:hypothetical protein
MAAAVNPKACPLASASMNARDPVKDIFRRIWHVSGNLTLQSYPTPETGISLFFNQTYTFLDFKLQVPDQLSSLSGWAPLAQLFLDIETEIRHANSGQNNKRSDESNLTFSSPNQDRFNGRHNFFVYPTVFCLQFQ